MLEVEGRPAAQSAATMASTIVRELRTVEATPWVSDPDLTPGSITRQATDADSRLPAPGSRLPAPGSRFPVPGSGHIIGQCGACAASSQCCSSAPKRRRQPRRTCQEGRSSTR